jgi:23S rRNA (adenine2503-C2)-methyltransferase
MPPNLKPVLSGYPPGELAALLAPLPAYRSRQIFTWISRGIPSFADMTDLPRELRADLDAKFSLYSSVVSARLQDGDGTEKLQITLHDGCRIEAVLLRDGRDRLTACLSTQAGCPMACVFCKTGALGFRRNLDSAEMVEQFLRLRDNPAGGENREIANIVIMGMGEPLLNLEELRRAIAVFTAPEGLGLSRRRITVSTSGIAGGIRDLADKGPHLRLALSLTTACAELRERLMPVTHANPLPDVKKALHYYQARENHRITVEMVLLGGINTRIRDADALRTFVTGLDAVVNLIPWNPVEGMCFEGKPLREPGSRELVTFMAELEKRGIKATRRYRKGRNIGGACGQLGDVMQAPLDSPS